MKFQSVGSKQPWQLEAGATSLPEGGVRFQLWAPYAKEVEVKILLRDTTQQFPMNPLTDGLFEAIVQEASPGAHYLYVLDKDKMRPDPVSRFQPQGVHGFSQVVDPHSFMWNDRNWKGIPLREMIIYEIHIGTFAAEGTFGSLVSRLKYLKDELGVTAIELMPIAQFPGGRNWGYDGVYPYAPQNTYGGPLGVKELVNACHQKGLAVVLDVVYNHVGPEGNYLADFGPYFTDRYETPWGLAINYDGIESEYVRRYIIENALHWITEYHIDALRLDAIHGIFDSSPKHILQEIAEWVDLQAEALDRNVLLIAESNLNDARFIRPVNASGYGLDAQWNDDFHHSIHAFLTGESQGYYQDYGSLSQVAKAIEDGFVFSGEYSNFRRRGYGESSRDRPGQQFVVFSQNHDQVGNRALGDRLATLIPIEAAKLAAGLTIFSPNIPLLFMGEEYGETAAFLYFTDFSDLKLAEEVRKGRRREFAEFQWVEAIPDPQDSSTFQRSRLDLSLIHNESNRSLLKFYSDMIRLRKEHPALNNCSKANLRVIRLDQERSLIVHRWEPGVEDILIIYVLNRTSVNLSLALPPGRWKYIFDSMSPEYARQVGSVSPQQYIEVSDNGEYEMHRPPYSLIIYHQ